MNRAVLAAVVAFWISPAHADDLQAIVAKYIDWRGGAAFKALRSIHERGEATLGGEHGTFEWWLTRNGRARRDLTLGPIESLEAATATDGWTRNASGQIDDLPDDGAADRNEAMLEFSPGAGRAGATYSLQPAEQREGRSWAVVRVRFAGADSYDLFLSTATGELLGERVTEDNESRFMRYGDWRMVNGVRLPFEQRQIPEGANAQSPGGPSFRVTSVHINLPPPGNIWSRPRSMRIWSFAGDQHDTGWIPFELFNDDQIFIPAQLQGISTHLLLDSGAGITVLDSNFARQAGIRVAGELPARGIQRVSMKVGSDLEITLGNLSLRHITAGIIDLADLAQQMGHDLPLVLGREVFNALIVDIDFPHHRIAFHDAGDYSAPRGAIRIPLGRHGNQRTVLLSIEGGSAVPFDFDLGNNAPLIVFSAYRDRRHLLDHRRQSTDLIGGVGGVATVKVATLAALTIGGTRLSDIPTEFPDLANSDLNSDRIAGNVGLPVFSRFRLITDYLHDALWLVPDASAISLPFAKDRSGLIAPPEKGRLKVLLVAPGSPADLAGWKAGNEIIAVDGHSIDAAFSASPVARWNQQPAGTVVSLTRSDHSTHELKLADYY